MREILFRGKRTDTKEWVYGDFLHDFSLNKPGHNFDDCIRQDVKHGISGYYPVDPETVGEYVPKMDFYEGDVLQGYESGDFGTILSEWVGIVKYDETTGRIRIIDDLGDWYETDDFIFDKVLGNVHDHPEFQMIDPNY